MNTLEIDWIDTSDWMSPCRVDLTVCRDERDAVDAGVDLGQGRDVVGVLAFLQVLVLGVGRIQRRLDRGRGLGLGQGRPQEADNQRQNRLASPILCIVLSMRFMLCTSLGFYLAADIRRRS